MLLPLNVALSQDSCMVERFAVSQKLIERFNVRLPPPFLIVPRFWLVGWFQQKFICGSFFKMFFQVKIVEQRYQHLYSNGMKCLKYTSYLRMDQMQSRWNNHWISFDLFMWENFSWSRCFSLALFQFLSSFLGKESPDTTEFLGVILALKKVKELFTSLNFRSNPIVFL